VIDNVKEPKMTDRPSDAAIIHAYRTLQRGAAANDSFILNHASKGVIAMATELDRLGYTPPDNPLLIVAREICDNLRYNNAACSSGEYDDNRYVQFVLAKLREIKGD
jgi:hypothetical protein